MSLTEILKTAYRALSANKVRTFLTMLGVIIGVFSVTVLVTITKTFQNYVEDQFATLGANLVFVLPGKASPGQDPAASFTSSKLDIRQVKQLERINGAYDMLVTPTSEFQMTAKYKSKEYSAGISASYYNAVTIYSMKMRSGKFFGKTESDSGSRVAVLGPEVVKNLFGSANPVGSTIKLGDKSFEVVGVFESKGEQFDQLIYIPFAAAKKVFDIDMISSMSLKVLGSTDIESAKREIEVTMLQDLNADEFSVMTQSDVLETVQNILGVLSAGLAGIAGISLIVGGIGVMNIMLVAVTERTREIGLRKALGATSGWIVYQFLVEAVFVSFLGGLIGLVFAYLTAFIAGQAVTYVRVEVPLWATIVALGFSSLVGIVFGTYPAYRAGRLDPIESLRYE